MLKYLVAFTLISTTALAQEAGPKRSGPHDPYTAEIVRCFSVPVKELDACLEKLKR